MNKHNQAEDLLPDIPGGEMAVASILFRRAVFSPELLTRNRQQETLQYPEAFRALAFFPTREKVETSHRHE